jgi:hypothetical protein
MSRLTERTPLAFLVDKSRPIKNSNEITVVETAVGG